MKLDLETNFKKLRDKIIQGNVLVSKSTNTPNKVQRILREKKSSTLKVLERAFKN